jgi:hypothetical protein
VLIELFDRLQLYRLDPGKGIPRNTHLGAAQGVSARHERSRDMSLIPHSHHAAHQGNHRNKGSPAG